MTKTTANRRVGDDIGFGDQIQINGFPYAVVSNNAHGLSSRRIAVRLVRPNGSLSPNVVEVVYHAHEYVDVTR